MYVLSGDSTRVNCFNAIAPNDALRSPLHIGEPMTIHVAGMQPVCNRLKRPVALREQTTRAMEKNEKLPKLE